MSRNSVIDVLISVEQSTEEALAMVAAIYPACDDGMEEEVPALPEPLVAKKPPGPVVVAPGFPPARE